MNDRQELPTWQRMLLVATATVLPWMLAALLIITIFQERATDQQQVHQAEERTRAAIATVVAELEAQHELLLEELRDVQREQRRRGGDTTIIEGDRNTTNNRPSPRGSSSPSSSPSPTPSCLLDLVCPRRAPSAPGAPGPSLMVLPLLLGSAALSVWIRMGR